MKTAMKIALALTAAIFVGFLIYIVVIMFMQTSSSGEPTEISDEYGDFKYILAEYKGSKKKYISLNGLTEEGQKKEVLIVPKEINGYPVEELSSGVNWFSDKTDYNYGLLVSNRLKVIYITSPDIEVSARDTFIGCPNLEKIVLLGSEVDFQSNLYYLLSDNQKEYFRYMKGLPLYYDEDAPFGYTNVTYFYNHSETESDGCYLADYFAYGTKIEYVPENPTREGYIFGGWYRDMACEHQWDFETDTLPEAIYNEDGDALYQETRLYAKWIKA